MKTGLDNISRCVDSVLKSAGIEVSPSQSQSLKRASGSFCWLGYVSGTNAIFSSAAVHQGTYIRTIHKIIQTNTKIVVSCHLVLFRGSFYLPKRNDVRFEVVERLRKRWTNLVLCYAFKPRKRLLEVAHSSSRSKHRGPPLAGDLKIYGPKRRRYSP
jgi:hypothetical protein